MWKGRERERSVKDVPVVFNTVVLMGPLHTPADREREAAWLHRRRALGDVCEEVIQVHRPGYRGAHLPSEGETAAQALSPFPQILHVAKESSVTVPLVMPCEFQNIQPMCRRSSLGKYF